MKTFLITRTGTTESTPIRATSKAEAMVKYVDTYWSSWYFSATGSFSFYRSSPYIATHRLKSTIRQKAIKISCRRSKKIYLFSIKMSEVAH